MICNDGHYSYRNTLSLVPLEISRHKMSRLPSATGGFTQSPLNADYLPRPIIKRDTSLISIHKPVSVRRDGRFLADRNFSNQG